MPKPFTTIPLGPWPQGQFQPKRVTEVPTGGLLDAVNVDIRPAGSAVTRPEWVVVDAVPRCSDLYEHSTGVYGVVGGEVGVLTPDGFEGLLPVSSRVAWCDLAGLPCFATSDLVYLIENGVVRLLSETSPGDDRDYDNPMMGLVGGHWIDYWNGRLIVARGGRLVFSEPLRYGVTNRLTGYMLLGGRAEWLVALETGFYVGLRDRVLWFAGRDPASLARTVVGSRSAPGMGIRVPAEFLGVDSRSDFAVFFTESGFAVGDAQGTVSYPQASRFDAIPLFRGKIMRHGSRLYAVRGAA